MEYFASPKRTENERAILFWNNVTISADNKYIDLRKTLSSLFQNILIIYRLYFSRDHQCLHINYRPLKFPTYSHLLFSKLFLFV